jgi:hypothetical protein
MQDRADSQVAQPGDQPGPAGEHDELGAIPRADGPPARQPL